MLPVFIQIIVLLLFPPLLLGIINKTKAFWAGRKGPSLFQPYYDIRKNLLKGFVFSTSTTWIFKAAPIVTVISIGMAGLLLPTIIEKGVYSFSGDVFLFVYLFSLSRFFITCSALDTASSFEGMGAAREVTFACFSELALFLILLIYAKLGNSLQLDQMLPDRGDSLLDKTNASLILVVFSLFVILLVENCRIPFDDPNTHLELTMIHEVIVLDHSGPLLGLIMYGAALRFYVLSSILVRTVFNMRFDVMALNVAIFLAGITLLSILVGTVESIMARIKLIRIPGLIITSCVLAVFGLIFVMK
ncbi:MAG: NADH-quinone oxidoreductase subunit H [Oligoflexales bacterium]|nr:NADH-quinone oxidoreductase subunit H [Oligoflexales bacterium]